MIEEREFRDVMRRFPTGVTIVTTRGVDGAPTGLTVSAFTSVSLEPILVLVCVHRGAASHHHILRRGSFAVNILAEGQADLAIRFSSGVPEDRFSGLEHDPSPLGNPLIPNSLAWLDCRVTGVFPGGDHSLILGEVLGSGARKATPLLFHEGALKGMGS